MNKLVLTMWDSIHDSNLTEELIQQTESLCKSMYGDQRSIHLVHREEWTDVYVVERFWGLERCIEKGLTMGLERVIMDDGREILLPPPQRSGTEGQNASYAKQAAEKLAGKTTQIEFLKNRSHG